MVFNPYSDVIGAEKVTREQMIYICEEYARIMAEEDEEEDFSMSADLRGTLGVGIFIVGQYGIRFSGQSTLVADRHGNVGILRTYGEGGGSPSVSGGVVVQVTNAESIYSLESLGFAYGGSATLPNLSVSGGYDFIHGVDYIGSELSISLDPTKAGIPAEIHGEASYSELVVEFSEEEVEIINGMLEGLITNFGY